MAKDKADRPKMGDLIKQLPAIETPVQEVRPVVPKSTEELVRIHGFDVPAELGRRLKIYAATNNMRLREILIDAIDAYLPK